MFCDFVTIKVKNMEESLEFYTEFLGLTVATRFPGGPGVSIVFLKDDKGNKIELIHNSNEKFENAEGNQLVSLGFPVESVEDMLKIVQEKGLNIASGPIQTPNEIKFLFVEDPNGVEIEFIEGFKL